MLVTWKSSRTGKKKADRRLAALRAANAAQDGQVDQEETILAPPVTSTSAASSSVTAPAPLLVVDERLIKTPGSSATAHPFINDRLKHLKIPGLTDIDVFCQWSALNEVTDVSGTELQWTKDVDFLWGKVLWDWASSDPLIFYALLQAVLDKRYNITGTDHGKDIAAVNSQMIPLLSERISNPHKLNGLEAMAITGLTFMAMRTGDFATAQVHQRAIQRIFDLTKPDRHVWLYVYWASLRLSAAAFLPPFLRKEIPEDWPAGLLTKDQQAKAQRSALRDVRSFGNVLAADNREFYGCLRQLHEIGALQESFVESVQPLIAPVYSVCYDICSLHAKVHASSQALEQAALLELVAIAVKCCAWNKASYVGPHGGKVQQAILTHAVTLSASLPAYDSAGLAAKFGMNPRALLWLFLVLSAEAYWYLPETRDVWLRWLDSTRQSLALTSQSAFNRALAGFPCTGDKYWKRMVRAWQDAGGTIKNNSSWQREMEDNRRGLHGETAGFGKYLGILNFQVDVE